MNTCQFITNSQYPNVGQYTQLYCAGNVGYCAAQSSNVGMNDVSVNCNGITKPNANCFLGCSASVGCNNLTLYCINSTANCNVDGNVAIMDISESPTTFIPTQSPTIIPTKNPTHVPTAIPSKTLHSTPTQSPSIIPTSIPTYLPSLIPSFGY